MYNRTVWQNGSTPAINETNLNNIEDGIVKNESRGVLNRSAIVDNAAEIALLKEESEIPVGSFGKVDTFQDADNIDGGTSTYTGDSVFFEGSQTLEMVADQLNIEYQDFFVKIYTDRLNAIEVDSVINTTTVDAWSSIALDAADDVWNNKVIGITAVTAL